MKKLFIIFVVCFLSFNLFSIEFQTKPVFKFVTERSNKLVLFTNSTDTVKDLSSDDSQQKEPDKNKNPQFENPFKDADWSWANEQFRMERIFIAAGTVCAALGIPIMLIGLFEYLYPQSDKSNTSNNLYIGMMGIGGGLMALGGTFAIVGAIRWGYLKTKDKMEVSISFGNFYKIKIQ